MSDFLLGAKSIEKISHVHEDLQAVIRLAITKTSVDFTVLEGMRTLERQKQLVAAGKSRTMDSRHLTGHAVDLGAWIDNTINWDWTHYIKIAEAMKSSAEQLHAQIVWGGDWPTFKDGVHFQLARRAYPATAVLC